jgi:hypothetical protein
MLSDGTINDGRDRKIQQGFVILRVSDSLNLAPDPNAEAGTWEHFTSVAPPWLAFWAAYQPEIFGK